MKKLVILFFTLLTMLCAAVYVSAAELETVMTADDGTVTDGILHYTVTTDKAVSGTLICAVYDGNDVLTDISIEKSDTAKTEWNIEAKADAQIGTAKLMLWNSAEGMTPLAEAVEKQWTNSQWTEPTPKPKKIIHIQNIFGKGSANPLNGSRFTGTSYLNVLNSSSASRMDLPWFILVTFDACTRSGWHSHSSAQILLVTEGVGVLGLEDEAPRLMQAGDVIYIPANKKHFHSAIDDSEFAHIALNVGADGTTWGDNVSNDEYAELIETARENTALREHGETMFPKGDKIDSDRLYRGDAYKNILVPHDSDHDNCPEIDFITLEAGARTAWHIHKNGELIIVTDGSGTYQEEDGSEREINAGDVIEASSNKAHWIGTTDNSVSYIAVNGGNGEGEVIFGTSANGTNVAQTDAGAVTGSFSNGVYSFLGVQYATAPERFVRAQILSPWTETKSVASYGVASYQGTLFGGTASSTSGSNDCQNLNIWTPAINDGQKRAVMVWLHGGGFSTGSANESTYRGANLSAGNDVVVVGVNHRLNTFGHLDLSAYGDKYKNSENVGIQDIIDALEWIQANIESFGGDPNNVTVFGESGGGAKVLALMTSPYAKGLFHKGVVESGATETMGVAFMDKDISLALGARVLEKLNISSDNVDDIQRVSVSELQSAATTAQREIANEYKIPVSIGTGYAHEWEPVVDGDFLPTDPVLDNGFAEAGKDIPLLIGSNLHEWTDWGYPQTNMSDEAKAEYAKAYPNETHNNATRVDSFIRKSMLKIMAHKADQNGAKVYAYVFTKDGALTHGAEIPYVFNNTSNALGKTVSEAWANFAKTGIPSADGLPEWKAYDRSGGATMILDDTSYLAHNHDKELIALLEPDYIY